MGAIDTLDNHFTSLVSTYSLFQVVTRLQLASSVCTPAVDPSPSEAFSRPIRRWKSILERGYGRYTKLCLLRFSQSIIHYAAWYWMNKYIKSFTSLSHSNILFVVIQEAPVNNYNKKKCVRFEQTCIFFLIYFFCTRLQSLRQGLGWERKKKVIQVNNWKILMMPHPQSK